MIIGIKTNFPIVKSRHNLPFGRRVVGWSRSTYSIFKEFYSTIWFSLFFISCFSCCICTTNEPSFIKIAYCVSWRANFVDFSPANLVWLQDFCLIFFCDGTHIFVELLCQFSSEEQIITLEGNFVADPPIFKTHS